MMRWLSDHTGWAWLERLAYGAPLPTRSVPRRTIRHFYF